MLIFYFFFYRECLSLPLKRTLTLTLSLPYTISLFFSVCLSIYRTAWAFLPLSVSYSASLPLSILRCISHSTFLSSFLLFVFWPLAAFFGVISVLKWLLFSSASLHLSLVLCLWISSQKSFLVSVFSANIREWVLFLWICSSLLPSILNSV